MANDLPQCTIGIHLHEPCHKTVHCRRIGLRQFGDLSADDVILLTLRADLDSGPPESTVCFHHEQHYIARFESWQRVCCNPFGKHDTHSVKGSLRTLSLAESHDINTRHSLQVKPGWKICPTCRKTANDLEHKPAVSIPEEPEAHQVADVVFSEDVINTSLIATGYSPFKISRVSDPDKVSYGKRKLSQLLESSTEHVASA